MKHTAQIQSEFVKEASSWDRLTLKQQREYLSRHPKSKHKLTAKPTKMRAKEQKMDADLAGAKKQIKKEVEIEKAKELSTKVDKTIAKLKKQLAKNEKQLENAVTKEDKDDEREMVSMYKEDIKDAEQIKKLMQEGKISKAQKKIRSLDTAARDEYQISLYNFLNRHDV